MRLKNVDIDWCFSIPIQQIRIEKINSTIEKQLYYCCINNPSFNKDIEDPIYLIKVFDYSTLILEKNIDVFLERKLLFGELRFIPFIPARGNMKWTFIGERSNKRSLLSVPDYRLANLLTSTPPESRPWRIIEKGGISSWELSDIYPFNSVSHLDLGYDFGEITIKMLIYIRLINSELVKYESTFTFEEWKEILFGLIRSEESTKKASDKDLRSDIIEYYSYEFLYGILKYDDMWGMHKEFLP